MVTRRVAIGSLLAASACSRERPPESLSAATLVDGQSTLVTLPNSGSAWLSYFYLPKTAIDHIATQAAALKPKPGDFYPASKSLAFTRLDESAVLADYRVAHGDKVHALINCSFFERYDVATELSFPIKRDGKIITGGSSPYGPLDNPADPRYKDVMLKALVWNDRSIQVVDYDHITGGILNNDAFPNGLVTYDYKDHPANVLAGDPVGQYQLVGTFPTLDGGLPDVLFVLTIIKGRMVDGAALLARHGVAGTVLTLDGGPSTHLWTQSEGYAIKTESTSLPHYLGFRRR